jgi:hypothetical protein
MDEHVMEALGKAKIIIRDGKVVEVEEPQLILSSVHKYRG